ncbi:MAG: redoxin domain-containing (seleno)protein, partial [Gammaproteobacteria bacterium]|nr:redoxin domain-containing (seleno)protein [Gammaproteobacteria bacterium]
AQRLNPDSWNYHRQDWSFTPEEAGANWQKKAQALTKPYYEPIEGLDTL